VRRQSSVVIRLRENPYLLSFLPIAAGGTGPYAFWSEHKHSTIRENARRKITRDGTLGVRMQNAADPRSTVPYHAVRFYENEKSLSQIVAEFLGDGLAVGEPAIVVATPAQRAAILRELVARKVDVVPLQRSDELLLLDAEKTLSTFMINGEPNSAMFNHTMCEVIERACRGRQDCTVRVYGQMVDVLWQIGMHDAAIRLEMLWNELANTRSFSLLCGYAIGNFYKDANFQEICGQHTHILAADGAAAVA